MGPVLVGLFLWQAKLAGEGKERLGILQRLLVDKRIGQSYQPFRVMGDADTVKWF